MDDHLLNLRKLPFSITNKIGLLTVGREGLDPGSFMITKDFIGHISPGKLYKLVAIDAEMEEGTIHLPNYITLVECDQKVENPEPVNKVNRLNALPIPTPPAHGKLTGSWNQCLKYAKNNANILGGLGTFTTAQEAIDVPVITATDEALAFYGAYLVKIGQTLIFESKQDLPLTIMAVGHSYIDNYIMQDGLGDGEYIEYHNEPHFWLPLLLQSKGYILLGRKIENEYFLTGFKIPLNCGIYASPYVVHSDAFLIGEFLVMYTVAEEYSTVLIENETHQAIKINFVDE